MFSDLPSVTVWNSWKAKLKSERKLQAYPYYHVSFRYLGVSLRLAVLVDFQATVCQEVLIFTINILVYSFSVPFLLAFPSLSYCAARTLSQRCWRAMALAKAPSPVTDSRMRYSNHCFPSVGGDASTASLCRGGISLLHSFTSGKFNGLQGPITKAFFPSEAACHFSFNYRRQDKIVKAIQLY